MKKDRVSTIGKFGAFTVFLYITRFLSKILMLATIPMTKSNFEQMDQGLKTLYYKNRNRKQNNHLKGDLR